MGLTKSLSPPSLRINNLRVGLRREYWLVDLREQEVRVFVNEGRKYRSFGTFGRSEKVGTETLQGLDLDLEQVFDG